MCVCARRRRRRTAGYRLIASQMASFPTILSLVCCCCCLIGSGSQSVDESATLIVLPPALRNDISNSFSVCTAANGEVHLRIYDGSVLLAQVNGATLAGIPTNFSIASLTGSEASVYTVRLDWRVGDRSSVKYYQLPRATGTAKVYLETDKPLYKPTDTVRIRALPLTSQSETSTDPVILTITDTRGLVVWRKKVNVTTNEPFVKEEFQLPFHVTEGHWHLRAKDESGRKFMAETTFGVTKYELPLFQIFTITNTTHYSRSTDNILVSIFVRLATGRPVSGTVVLKCQTENGTETLITPSALLNNGEYETVIQPRQCRSGATDAPISGDIKITVEVRDYGSGTKLTETARLKFGAYPYDIEVMPLRQGIVHRFAYANNVKTEEVPIRIRVVSTGELPDDLIITTKVDCVQNRDPRLSTIQNVNTRLYSTGHVGEIFHVLNVSNPCMALVIEITGQSQRSLLNNLASKRLILPSFIRNSAAVLKLRKFSFNVGEIAVISIHRADGASSNQAQLRLLVVSSQKLILHTPTNSSDINLPITVEAVPEILLILYHVGNPWNGLVVDDVLRIFVNVDCSQNRVQVSPSSDLTQYQPGSAAKLTVRGRPNGYAGTKAVDERLSYLFNSLRRFEQADRLVLDGLVDLTTKLNDTAEQCCNAAKTWWQVYSSCLVLPVMGINHLNRCHESYIRCCHRTNAPMAAPNCQMGQSSCSRKNTIADGNGTSDGAVNPFDWTTRTISRDNSQLIRHYFPEVWLFQEFRLNDDGFAEIPITLPHSITNWTVHSSFWARGWPLCESALDISVKQSIYMEIDMPSVVFVNDQMLTKVIVHNFEPTAKKVNLRISKESGICTERDSFNGDKEFYLQSNQTTSIVVPFEFTKSTNSKIVFTLHEIVGHSRLMKIDQVVKEVQALDHERLDTALDYNFSWELGSGGEGVSKEHLNDTIIRYELTRAKYRNTTQISISLRLTDEALTQLKIRKVIAEFTPLPAVTRSRWSKLKFSSDAGRLLLNAPSLTELLRKVPAILQQVEERKDEPATSPEFIAANNLLHLSLMEALSFRTDGGAYSNKRIANQLSSSGSVVSESIWLSALTTALHCRAGMDTSVVCPSLKWFSQQQRPDGSFGVEATDIIYLLSDNDHMVTLTAVVLMTARVCANYSELCANDYKSQQLIFNRAMMFLMATDAKSLDSVALAATTLTFAMWKWPFVRFYNDVLLKQLVDGVDYPYWSYKPRMGSIFQRMKHKFKGWFWADYRQKLLSNQILLNSMSLLTQLTLGNPKQLNLERIGLWLISHRKSDGVMIRTMDTVMASRALMDLHSSLSRADTHVSTKISIQCRESGTCPSLEINSDNIELTQSLPFTIDERGLRFLAVGKGTVLVKFRFVSSISSRVPKFYPVTLQANVSNANGREFRHQLCFNTNNETIRMLTIDHSIPTGLSFVADSFSSIRGDAYIVSVEPSSHAIHLTFSDVRQQTEHCYSFLTKKSASVIYSRTRIITAKHETYGIVGMTIAGGRGGQDLPLLDKYCLPNSSECYCTEAACPLPKSECGQICSDSHTKELIRALCSSAYAGCLVKVASIETEIVRQRVYNRTFVMKHAFLTPNATDDECQDLMLLIRNDCHCPHVNIGGIYVLVVRRDMLPETRLDGSKWAIAVGEHVFFEPFFSCANQRPIDIHRLVEDNYRREVCASVAQIAL